LSFLQLTFSIVTFSGQNSQIREAKMSLGISSRLKHPKKHELIKSHSQAQILANKLRQDGVLTTGTRTPASVKKPTFFSES
jgi:hypothetical protein